MVSTPPGAIWLIGTSVPNPTCEGYVWPTMILQVQELGVSFDHTPILSDLSFAVEEGESVAIVGPNGAGKTVLFRALIGTLPHQGTVRWAPGTRIGYVPQKLDLERDLPLTGWDLLHARHKLSPTPRDIEWALERVDLQREARLPIGALSGGQFQRLLFALALVGRPNVLLLDEPTAGVDLPGQERLTAILQDERLTVLHISHDLSVVFRTSDHVLCLSRRKAWYGTPRTILTPERLREVYGAPVDFHVHGP